MATLPFFAILRYPNVFIASCGRFLETQLRLAVPTPYFSPPESGNPGYIIFWKSTLYCDNMRAV